MNGNYAPPPPNPPNPHGNPFASGQPSDPYANNPYANNPYAGGPAGGPTGNPFAQASAGFNPYAPPSSQAELYAMPSFDASEVPLAERGTRLGASIIDGLLMAACAGLPAAIGAAASMEAAIAGGVVGYLAIAIYQWYLISTTGQSLAKKWMGIRVVKLDGSLPGFLHGVVLRVWVIGFIAGLVGFVGLIDALLIFGDERRCLHDYIASTKVVIAQG